MEAGRKRRSGIMLTMRSGLHAQCRPDCRLEPSYPYKLYGFPGKPYEPLALLLILTNSSPRLLSARTQWQIFGVNPARSSETPYSKKRCCILALLNNSLNMASTTPATRHTIRDSCWRPHDSGLHGADDELQRRGPWADG